MVKHDEIDLHILATSDMHSYVLKEKEGPNIYRAGTYIEKVRENHQNVILLDNGGSLAGSITAFYYAIIAPYKRHPMIKLMNELEYDASGLSANEFKFGLDFLNRAVALARFPWLSSNIEYAMTKEPYFSTPYLIKKINGLKVGVVGLTSESLVKNEHIEMEDDVFVERTTLAAKRWIRYIYETESPDFLIVLYHGEHSKLARAQYYEETNTAEKIISQMGITDVLITGHQHETIIEHEGKTLFVQAGENAENIVHIAAKFKKRRNSYELLDIQPEIVDLSQYEESDTLLALTHYDRKAIRNWRDTPVTTEEVQASFSDFEEVLTPNHPFIRLLHDSVNNALNASITCVHLPLPDSEGLKGPLTYKDIYRAYPHPDKPIDVTLKGHQIKDLIEESAAHLQEVDGTIQIKNMDPSLYLFWDGFDYTIDLSQRLYERVTQFSLQQDYSYRITMTDYSYRHYRYLLNGATIHHTSETVMPERIARVIQMQSELSDSTANIHIKQLHHD